MQADDLDASALAALHAHTRECDECRAVLEGHVQVDDTIGKYLDTASQFPSSRDVIKARIMVGEDATQRSFLSHQTRRLRAFRLRPRFLAVPFALCALAGALSIPQNADSPVFRVQPVAAISWARSNPYVGFPLAVDATRPGHLLAGAHGRVYESYDAGDHWRPLAPLPPHLVIRAVAVDRQHSSRYLVATLRSIYVTNDHGRHWSAAATALLGAEVMFLLQDPRRADTFYAGPSVLWRSTDSGKTWKRLGRGRVFAPSGIQSLAFMRNGTLVTGIWGGGVAVSHDGGVTWHRRSLGLAKNVMDVSPLASGRIYVATDRGVFTGVAGATAWRRSGPAQHFFATSLLQAGTSILVGGDGALYRSDDGGVSWQLSMAGLQLAPYINALTLDAFKPDRVYASVNADGLFRSDDQGRHWVAINRGIPLSPVPGTSTRILFLRSGTLWSTDSQGTDPGVLTVDADVRGASLAPDGRAIAYVVGASPTWEVKVLAPRKSGARTVVRLHDRRPPRLYWSPDSALLAVASSSAVTVSNLTRTIHTFLLAGNLRPVGWMGDGSTFLLWSGRTRRLLRLSRATRLTPATIEYDGVYEMPPVLAPDHRHVAAAYRGQLFVQPVEGGPATTTSVPATCIVRTWSQDSRAVVLFCGREVQVRAVSGIVLGQAPVADVTQVIVPNAARGPVLLFARGALWSATRSGQMREIVAAASPA